MRTIEEFRDLGVNVLEPPYNSWIYVEPKIILTPKDVYFRPLTGEQAMTIRQVEDGFLAHLAVANIHYVDNHQGYIGNSTGLELGFAIARASVSNYPLIASRVPLASNLELSTMFPGAVRQIKALTPDLVVKELINEIGYY